MASPGIRNTLFRVGDGCTVAFPWGGADETLVLGGAALTDEYARSDDAQTPRRTRAWKRYALAPHSRRAGKRGFVALHEAAVGNLRIERVHGSPRSVMDLVGDVDGDDDDDPHARSKRIALCLSAVGASLPPGEPAGKRHRGPSSRARKRPRHAGARASSRERCERSWDAVFGQEDSPGGLELPETPHRRTRLPRAPGAKHETTLARVLRMVSEQLTGERAAGGPDARGSCAARRALEIMRDAIDEVEEDLDREVAAVAMGDIAPSIF